ncbi:GNAT family N-acetyltransferase [bacterium]|nr:GNAT family N-acetyltransferase [bacterium]
MGRSCRRRCRGTRSGRLGSRLLQSAIDYARSQNFSRITLLTDKSNTGAIRFYGRHGFVESEMTALRLMTNPGPGVAPNC